MAADTPAAGGAANAALVKLSKYDKAQYCDVAVGADGVLHVVFTERADYGKPAYLYYRTSADGGATWSEAKNLSDDESGNDAGYARVIFDGAGRLYAVWKYIPQGALLDGPGGEANGRIVYRALVGGAWSKRVEIGDKKLPSFSWFVATDAGGAVHLVWSQVARDVTAVSYFHYTHANLIREAVLDGAALGASKDLIAPKPLATPADEAAARAAGKPIPYEDTVPKRDGLINLRGYVDKDGAVKFVAEEQEMTSAPPDQRHGKLLVLWDGQKLSRVYEYEMYKTYNIFNNPPRLLVDAKGKTHLIRAPEEGKAEVASVRDYTLEDGELGDKVDAVAVKTGKGTLLNWQAHQLPGGKMAITAAMSEKGGYSPDDVEMYLTTSDGDGVWTPPVSLTNNAARKNGSYKETVGGAGAGTVNSYSPRFAAVAMGKDGKPVVVMVNSEDTIIGLTSVGTTASGRAVVSTGTGRVDAPAVFFVKM
ncbi:MAG: hypothetical protein GC159_09485 [Phycisphaera sp.]|nr:hypothetical protein [Phycisphaera sp.]